MEKKISLRVEVSEELASGLRAIAHLKKLSEEELLRIWIGEGLEREELRFERLLLFGELVDGLSDKELDFLARLREEYFEKEREERGLDSYLVKSRNKNLLYQIQREEISS